MVRRSMGRRISTLTAGVSGCRLVAAVALSAAAVAAGGDVATAAPRVPTRAAARLAEAVRHERAFIADINGLRAMRGLPALRVRANLTAKARGWAATMAADGTIRHSRLSSGVRGPWYKLGENVGRGVSQPALQAAFEASATHFENLVEPGFRHVGVGVVVSEGVIYVAEVFMQPPAARRSGATSAPRRRPAAAAQSAVPALARRSAARLGPPARPGPGARAGPLFRSPA